MVGALVIVRKMTYRDLAKCSAETFLALISLDCVLNEKPLDDEDGLLDTGDDCWGVALDVAEDTRLVDPY